MVSAKGNRSKSREYKRRDKEKYRTKKDNVWAEEVQKHHRKTPYNALSKQEIKRIVENEDQAY